MNKPLKDWTLAEAKAYCEGRTNCIGCPLLEASICNHYIMRWTPDPVVESEADHD